MNKLEFVSWVQKNVARVKQYKLGGDGTGGECDCIGLIIGALRLGGMKWTGIHGSNYAARYEMRDLKSLNSAGDLSVGAVVYKAKNANSSGYALPEKYKDHPDQLDYYHVGVVTKTTPLEITHCTGVEGGIKRDSTVGNWTHYGELKKVSIDTTPMTAHIVTGGRLALRNGAGTNHQVQLYIPDGTIVLAGDCGVDGWMAVHYDGTEGFCMSKYLTTDTPEDNGQTVCLVFDRKTAETIFEALKGVL